MAYIPKLPPYSTRPKSMGASLPSKIPVTSVTEVTDETSFDMNNADPAAVGDPPEMLDLVSRWLRERCVLSSPCATSGTLCIGVFPVGRSSSSMPTSSTCLPSTCSHSATRPTRAEWFKGWSWQQILWRRCGTSEPARVYRQMAGSLRKEKLTWQ